MLRAIALHGSALQYASVELQTNGDMVVAAIIKDPEALQYASTDLQRDKEILAKAYHATK